MLLENMDRFIYELEKVSEPEVLSFEDLVLEMSKMPVDQRREYMETLDDKTVDKIIKMMEGGLL